MKKTIVLGISGGIAAYKAIELLLLLQQAGYTVTCILTKHGAEMLPVTELKKVSQNSIYTELFTKDFDYRHTLETKEIDHISVAHAANVIVIAPATANTLAKLAAGIADDFLTTTVLAASCPIVIAPAMNTHMWNNPITQRNIAILRAVGYIVIAPTHGKLACGDEGIGKLAPVSTIAREVITIAEKTKALQAEKVIVTAGGTSEPIDAVRAITNKSSGKMGAALADSLYLRGAEVLFIHAKNSVVPQYSMREKIFETAEELEQILHEEVTKATMIIHAAAVSDFTVHTAQVGKIKSNKTAVLELTPREKILDKIKIWNASIVLVAFKAEASLSDAALTAIATDRLEKSHADFIVANHIDRVGHGFAGDTNAVIIIDKQKNIHKIPLSSKKTVGEEIVDIIFNL